MTLGFPSLNAQRSDGYSDGINTFQGVRAYDPNMNQWTTPDAYAGDVHDPMSQKPYMWNGNNPVQYSDPSGYEACGTPGTCGTDNNGKVLQTKGGRPNSDFVLKVEASAGAGPFGVSGSISISTAPALFVAGGASVGFGKPAKTMGKLGGYLSVQAGIATAKAGGHNTSGVLSQGSKGLAVGDGFGVEHPSNSDGQYNGAGLFFGGFAGGVASYGFQLAGGTGSSTSKSKKPEQR